MGNYVRDRYNCRNFFLKVQNNGKLCKSHDKPVHVLIALERTKSWECVVPFNGILKSPIFSSFIWCLTSPLLRKSLIMYVQLITLQACILSSWLISLSRGNLFLLYKISLEWGCWPATKSVPTNRFVAVHKVFIFVRYVEDKTLLL